MRLAGLATLLVLLIPGSGLADSAYDRCMAQSDGTNVAWGECGRALVDREEQCLNDTWKTLVPTMSASMKRDLRAEQLAWVKFKDLSCSYYSSGEFGREGQVIHAPLCRAAIIRARTVFLQNVTDPYGVKQ